MNTFDMMRQAMTEAEITMRAADEVADRMARMLSGRLRKVQSNHVLAQLKRELRDYNIQTGDWKDRP